MTRVAVPDAAARFGIAPADYPEICRRLGREPTPIEARMVAVMWSEHCGYKHSKRALRRLPTRSPRLLAGPGENAGVVDVGCGWALAFKMESHNHPSAVDPYNGAATGVGGIIRDILAMGARPVALLDSLRFGPLQEARARRLLAGVTSGIAGYGNAIGVPTVGGELRADPCYRDTPLVNVACLGLVRSTRVATSAAAGPGNAVLYAGARTGRDGIGGAAFASTGLDEEHADLDRASVQIGDPFTGKLLIEATLEALETGGVVALQDLGAAGLTGAASEMAARGGVGMEIALDRVPLREAGMRPDEILLSESQERMLLVVQPDQVAQVRSAYQRWGLAAEVIGQVTDDRRLRIECGGRRVADLPPEALAGAPAYDPAAQPPEDLDARWALRAGDVPATDPAQALVRLLAHPDVASKRAVFEQYDHMVGIRTVVRPGADAAVLRLLEAPPLGLALTADGNGRWCAADPRRGAALAVLEAAANLACAGAEPLAVTDCLNFGSPERPQVFWAFGEVIEGLAEACAALDVPVVGGNVSFYNEAGGADGDHAVAPTPVVGMVGVIDDVARVVRPDAVCAGHLIVLVGEPIGTLGASLLVQVLCGGVLGRPADPAAERTGRAIRCVREAVRAGIPSAVHDCSDGGIAVALAEACLLAGLGGTAVVPACTGVVAPAGTPAAALEALFGEGPGRFVMILPPQRLASLASLARAHGVPLTVLGTAEGDTLSVRVDVGDTAAPDRTGGSQGARAVERSLADLAAAWGSLEV